MQPFPLNQPVLTSDIDTLAESSCRTIVRIMVAEGVHGDSEMREVIAKRESSVATGRFDLHEVPKSRLMKKLVHEYSAWKEGRQTATVAMQKVGMTRTAFYQRVKEYEETLATRTEKDTKYSIGEVAKMTGTTVPTVRYYDEIGLLKPAEVTTGRYRLYTMEEIWRLQMILTLRNLGFGLEEVRKLLSGETSVDTVIDWQMEALDTQIRTLTGVKSILEQAQQSNYGEDSIDFLRELIQSISVTTEERKRFITEKIIDSVVPDNVPVEWKESFIGNSIEVFTKKGKLSAQQTTALLEIEELLDDPLFVAEIRHGIEIAMNSIKQTRIDVTTWSVKMEELKIRLLNAVKQKESPDSPVVQVIVNEHASLFANTEQLPVCPKFFRQFATGWLKLKNGRVNRYAKLCSILHPPVKLEVKARSLLMKGIQWKLEHLESE